MRAANLFLFLGTIGLLNIYEDFMGDDEGGKMDPAEAKRLQKKMGVKERRSAVDKNPKSELKSHFDEYSEELVEFMKRKVLNGFDGCEKADENTCNCIMLVCFGQSDCAANVTARRQQQQKQQQQQLQQEQKRMPQLASNDPRYAYYAASQRLRARHEASQRMRAREAKARRRQFLSCRQTTIDEYVLCECKKYTRLKG